MMILISTCSVQGNQILHEITVHELYELRVNLEDFDGNKRFAKYSHFRIGNEADGSSNFVWLYVRGTQVNQNLLHLYSDFI